MPVGRPWKDQDDIQKKKILKAIRESKDPFMNITQIADETGIYRNTVAKYISKLKKEKKITTQKIGDVHILTTVSRTSRVQFVLSTSSCKKIMLHGINV